MALCRGKKHLGELPLQLQSAKTALRGARWAEEALWSLPHLFQGGEGESQGELMGDQQLSRRELREPKPSK